MVRFVPALLLVVGTARAAVPGHFDFTDSGKPFVFSEPAGEGNYRVTATLGNSAAACSTTVKAESRRLMVERIDTLAGQFMPVTFIVNVRNSKLPAPPLNAPGGDEVRLNKREAGVLHWDDKLTLEFSGAQPCVTALDIAKADDLPTVFLAGDSTVTDQPREPTTSWGQMLTRFFKPDIAVANHAESGETLKSFITGLRLDKILSQIRKGDYLLIQFGHNDMKQNWPQTYVEPFSTHKQYLKVLIAEARLRGAYPVLITPMQRHNFDGLKVRNTLGDFPESVRQTAKEEKVPLIDLTLMSVAFYEALGPEKSWLAFSGGRDATHHSAYGAYELAKCVAEGIRKAVPSLAAHLVSDYKPFDPAHPDAADSTGNTVRLDLRNRPGDSISVPVAEGNYRVTATFGDPKQATVTTVKAELRRLVLEKVVTAPGRSETRTFLVNVRTPAIPGGGQVRLKPRETAAEAMGWDDKLALAFTNEHPGVTQLEIARADDVPTLFIAGDSTSTDQPGEPFNSWGQMITRFLKPEIAVANHGESGESLRSFFGEKRFDKIRSLMRAGDYLMIQMGHNDQKDKTEGAGAFTSYKDFLKQMIVAAHEKGVTPILVTPMNRLTFDAAGKITNSLGDFPEAVRRTAQEQGVALIDLHAMSAPFYEALGPVNAHKAFAGNDTTHHSDYGSYELAKCIVQAIRAGKMPLAQYVTDDFTGFDPAYPDAVESFAVPPDRARKPADRPLGN
jgi:lysophospholipase L1-like esterase